MGWVVQKQNLWILLLQITVRLGASLNSRKSFQNNHTAFVILFRTKVEDKLSTLMLIMWKL